MKREEISEIREDYERFDLDKLIEFLQYGKKKRCDTRSNQI